MSNRLEVKLLGRFDVSHDGKTIAITSRPAQSLFAYLILSAGTAHRREKLAGLLWPDSLEETARDNLRHALWRVRKALPSNSAAEYMLTDDLSITFNASADYWLDVNQLEKLSEDASADELMAVLSEYQGELLPGFYDEWVLLEREHLHMRIFVLESFENLFERLFAIVRAAVDLIGEIQIASHVRLTKSLQHTVEGSDEAENQQGSQPMKHNSEARE